MGFIEDVFLLVQQSSRQLHSECFLVKALIRCYDVIVLITSKL